MIKKFLLFFLFLIFLLIFFIAYLNYIGLETDKFNSTIKCFCVGKATEFTARQFGFIHTYTSEGTVDSLIEIIKR